MERDGKCNGVEDGTERSEVEDGTEWNEEERVMSLADLMEEEGSGI